ncbi:beta-propeller fold lactonase family protein [Kitasatospora aureofaciens]|uniref:YVTN family beta-propeller repeat protein n=1 Tax=Kitasatospora aureofaciens TaxID=1894 RepID=UPI00099C0B43|nr:beta-propeller fold lactonase family protein [Kitasatospora aureofaciens]
MRPPRAPRRAWTAVAAISAATAALLSQPVTAEAAAPAPTVTAHVPVAPYPAGLALTPDGARAYVTSQSSGTVSVLDTASKVVTGSFTAGTGSYAVAVSPDGQRAYLTHHLDNTVSVVDTASNTVTATVPVGAQPWGLVLSPDGKRAYVSNAGAGTVSVLDTSSGTVTATVPVGAEPHGLAVSPDGKRLYVAASGAKAVNVVDTVSSTVSATVQVGHSAFGLALSPDGSRLWVADGDDTTAAVLDTGANTLLGTVTVGNGPYAVSLAPDGSTAYVSNYGDNTLSVIDAASRSVTATVPVGASPYTLALSADGRRGYLADFTGNAVDVLNFPLPVPAVTVISPNGGSGVGGTTVTVTGTDLNGATGVTFGAAGPATSFSCTRTSCTATAPATTVTGPVDVQVTTPGGTSAAVAADRFTYTAPSAHLVVALAATPVTGLFASRVDYTVTLTGQGPDPVTAATVSAALPAGLTTTSGDCTVAGGRLTCTLSAPLAKGASTTRHFSVGGAGLNVLASWSITVARTAGAPADPSPATSKDSRSCTSVLGLLITCS